MYADDILLLSASVVTLQSMLSICSEYGRKHDIIFNCKKSMCMAVGFKWKTAISPMLLDDVPIPWVKSIKYLGIVLVAGISMHVDCGYIKRKFYASYNYIAKCKNADEFVKLSLVKSMCLPLLTYCLGALDLPQYEVRDLGTCWNDSFRKIFHFNRWESVPEIQHYCGELSFVGMYNKYKEKFLSSIISTHYYPACIRIWTWIDK